MSPAVFRYATYAIGGGGSWARLRELGAKPLILKPQLNSLLGPDVGNLQRAALCFLQPVNLGAQFEHFFHPGQQHVVHGPRLKRRPIESGGCSKGQRRVSGSARRSREIGLIRRLVEIGLKAKK